MTHIYNNQFFDYIDGGARASARRMIGLIRPWLGMQSVLDLGCGRGAWLAEWITAGVTDVTGVDGAYVDRTALLVPGHAFLAADLTRPVETGRRFDLAQSLEVGEHLPETASATLVDSLTRASDRVLFSAAVNGQGGEFHVNEQPLSFWQDLFAAQGYTAFDCIRPNLRHAGDVEPWYRYNTVLYVNAAGRAGLPQQVLEREIPAGTALENAGSLGWRMRRSVVSFLPRPAVTRIAQVRAAAIARQARRQEA